MRKAVETIGVTTIGVLLIRIVCVLLFVVPGVSLIRGTSRRQRNGRSRRLRWTGPQSVEALSVVSDPQDAVECLSSWQVHRQSDCQYLGFSCDEHTARSRQRQDRPKLWNTLFRGSEPSVVRAVELVGLSAPVRRTMPNGIDASCSNIGPMKKQEAVQCDSSMPGLIDRKPASPLDVVSQPSVE